MTPSNICSGFKKCGIYPFNPNAIKCDLVASSDVHNDGCDDDAGSASDGDEGDSLPNESEFSADNVELFQQRHEGSYDLYDPEYIRWLEVHHPATPLHLESIPPHLEWTYLDPPMPPYLEWTYLDPPMPPHLE